MNTIMVVVLKVLFPLGLSLSYIVIHSVIFRNGPTNVNKSGKGVLVQCRVPPLPSRRGLGRDTIYESIPKTENAKGFLDVVGKKYIKFSKNEKNELLNTLHSTFYDGISWVRGHIDKILSCYNKIKIIGMEFDWDYVVWLIMGTLSSHFDSIRSSYNAQKKKWTIGEMTAILAKENEDMKKGRSMSISIMTTQGSGD